jgi:uncharacterized OB-fold protein
MNEKITGATVRAIAFDADAATLKFYAALRERRFRGTRCLACGVTPFPPREHCPRCGNGSDTIEWIDLPRRGTLHAFSQQQRSWRFSRPDVLGLVSLPGVDGLVLTKIAGRIEALAIGQAVEVDFLEIGKELVVHQFTPPPAYGSNEEGSK